MDIEEATEIIDLMSFTDHEILKSAKYRCTEDGSNVDCLVYKIKIGKMIFTTKISPADPHFPPNELTKRKLANGAMRFLVARIRQGSGLYSNGVRE